MSLKSYLENGVIFNIMDHHYMCVLILMLIFTLSSKLYWSALVVPDWIFGGLGQSWHQGTQSCVIFEFLSILVL